MTLPIPYGPSGQAPQFDRIVASLLEADQFDDWLPDPLFYLDRSAGLQATTQQLAEIWRSQQISTDGLVALTLPRASGRNLPALAIPFNLRCVAHAVISDFAGRIQNQLIRDKVLGFQFQPAGTNALFTPPGDEMSDLAKAVIEAAVVDGASRITMVDVADFSGQAMAPNLTKVLTSAGVDNAQALFLERVLKSAPAGLPSIDDAFAYVYNYYLKPVDDELAKRRINFFRYRDEYFVLSEEDANAVVSRLAALNLGATTTDFRTSQDELEPDLLEQAANSMNQSDPDEAIRAREELARLGDVAIVAVCSVKPQDLNSCQSDSFMLTFEDHEDDVVTQAFDDAMAGKFLDSVDLAPVLRSYNRVRASAVPFVAPFDATPASHQQLSAQMTDRQAALRNALSAGLQSNRAPWQVQWAAALLGEAKSLEPASTQLLATALGQDLPPEVAWQLRMVLARREQPDPDMVWAEVRSDDSPYAQRAAALTAFYLAKRNIEAPWNALKSNDWFGDAVLRDWLVANL